MKDGGRRDFVGFQNANRIREHFLVKVTRHAPITTQMQSARTEEPETSGVPERRLQVSWRSRRRRDRCTRMTLGGRVDRSHWQLEAVVILDQDRAARPGRKGSRERSSICHGAKGSEGNATQRRMKVRSFGAEPHVTPRITNTEKRCQPVPGPWAQRNQDICRPRPEKAPRALAAAR